MVLYFPGKFIVSILPFEWTIRKFPKLVGSPLPNWWMVSLCGWSMDKRQICTSPKLARSGKWFVALTSPVFMGDPLRNVCGGLQVNSIDGHHSTGFAYRWNAGGVCCYLWSFFLGCWISVNVNIAIFFSGNHPCGCDSCAYYLHSITFE